MVILICSLLNRGGPAFSKGDPAFSRGGGGPGSSCLILIIIECFTFQAKSCPFTLTLSKYAYADL